MEELKVKYLEKYVNKSLDGELLGTIYPDKIELFEKVNEIIEKHNQLIDKIIKGRRIMEEQVYKIDQDDDEGEF